MTSKPQTAIRGVFSVAVINVFARLIGYVKHILITAFIGLSAGLDAFFVAMTILSIFILTFGDIFDSLGVPRLVRTLREGGEDAFRRLAGNLFMLAILLSAALCLLLFAVAPWTPWIAPGFAEGKKTLVVSNLHYLAPMAALYLPYHALGSILRARRRFKDFYLGELINGILVIAILFYGREHPFIIPIATSGGYLFVIMYMMAIGRTEIRLANAFDPRTIREFFRLLLALLPLYLLSYLTPLVDRTFASYLPTGAVSALSYGFLIVMIPSSILMMENVFITPLSEDSDRAKLMSDILCGIVIMAVPAAIFVSANSALIVKAGFERGVFTPASTAMTADALAFLAASIPAFLAWPVCYRLFQVLERFKAIGFVISGAILVHVLLNIIFMKMQLGVKGLALATSLSSFTSVVGAFLLLRAYGLRIVSRETLQVLIVAIAASAVALAGSSAIPLKMSHGLDIFPRGIAYTLIVSGIYLVMPNETIRNWRTTVMSQIAPRWFSG